MVDVNAVNAIFGAILGAPVLTLLGSFAKRVWDNRDQEREERGNAPLVSVKATDAVVLTMERTMITLERQRDEAWAEVDRLRARVDTLESSLDTLQSQLRTASADITTAQHEAATLRRALDAVKRPSAE